VATIVSVHSFRGGTGKSNTTANLAALLGMNGSRVGVIDTDIQSPGIHVLFGLSSRGIGASLNDYLWHGAEIADTAHDVTPESCNGRVFLIPSSTNPGDISRVLREGYDAQRLTEGLRRLVDDLRLDVLLIDTHPGINEETLLSLVISDLLLIVMRPDQQDYEGTGIAVKIARGLEVPRMAILVNKCPASFDTAIVQSRVEEAYGCDVAAVIPHSDDLMTLASGGILVLEYPNHPVSNLYRGILSLVTS
jgi:septum site-determining protein MinD